MQVSTTHTPKEEMHVIDWIEAQNKDPAIRKAIEWIQLGKERSPEISSRGSWHPPQKDWDSSVGKSL